MTMEPIHDAQQNSNDTTTSPDKRNVSHNRNDTDDGNHDDHDDHDDVNTWRSNGHVGRDQG